MNDARDSLTISPISDADIDAVAALWQRCGLTREWNNPRGDIAFARKSPSSTILVGRSAGTIVATVLVGHDGHRGWVYYLAVEPTVQRNSHGRTIMAAAEDWLRERGVGKVMLMVRPDNSDVCAFYQALGYFDQPRTIFAKWLDGRAPTP